jgi:hypothetical protein
MWSSLAPLLPCLYDHTRRHQLLLCVSHKLGKQIVHPRHMLGIGRRVPDSEATCVRIQGRLKGVCAGVDTP